jgi:hypothetical protein
MSKTYVLERERKPFIATLVGFVEERLVFEVADKPEPNVMIRYYRDGTDWSHPHLIHGADDRDLHTLEEGRKIWRIHVEHGYERVEE